MSNIDAQKLIEAGVHFGCRVSRWNPKMAPFIHGRRGMIHVIDLRETVKGLLRAQNLLFRIASEGQTVLWVGTKRQVKGVIQDAGQRTCMPIVTERWIGGTLTNFSVIRSRLKRLAQLEAIDEKAIEQQKLTKKEVAQINRERRKIERNLGGIREMDRMPGAMVVVDPSREGNAIREARKMGIGVSGLLDTDCDPDDVDIVIPGSSRCDSSSRSASTRSRPGRISTRTTCRPSALPSGVTARTRSPATASDRRRATRCRRARTRPRARPRPRACAPRTCPGG